MIAKYTVRIPRNLEKTFREMPENAQKALLKLIDDIRETGPIQPKYHNYSMLGNDLYHCHLAYRWVAVWRCKKGSCYVEVEYAGSREKAPY